MPPQLLESQFATLQEPDAGEASIVVDIEDAPERIVQRIADSLAADVRA
jgi:gluconate kinase